jgi:hypothetical protein
MSVVKSKKQIYKNWAEYFYKLVNYKRFSDQAFWGLYYKLFTVATNTSVLLASAAAGASRVKPLRGLLALPSMVRESLLKGKTHYS